MIVVRCEAIAMCICIPSLYLQYMSIGRGNITSLQIDKTKNDLYSEKIMSLTAVICKITAFVIEKYLY